MAKKDFKGGLSSIISTTEEVQTTIPRVTPVRKLKPKYKKHQFTVSEEHLEKVRYIADMEPGGLKKFVHDAFKAQIEKYEKKNGVIEL